MGATVPIADALERAAEASSVPLSAKFEIDRRGRLSLSVCTAERGLGTDAEHNTFQEVHGTPEKDRWSPRVDALHDVAHVAVASGQLTLMRKTRVWLVDVTRMAAREGTVVPLAPTFRARQAMIVVRVANGGRERELTYDLVTGEEMGAARMSERWR